LLESAPLVRGAQNRIPEPLATTSVSSAVIKNPLIFDARVTQTGDTEHASLPEG
jgi:hypothetical protein